ncbi:MAG TPA: hypothetical protein PK668_07320 [Myxococcota bacterium]|nr:hypothetical protein [Myxococcota bacterium]HRY92345.1 hypothetical protein [Myxococcota bacterium]HSA23013.1 hypothetical protein [Myxococcota bacterium]
MRWTHVAWLCGALLAVGCNQELTLAEVQQALEESSRAEQALTFADGTVEITTHFTIGQAVEDAAQELRAFIQSQLPCAEVTLAGAVLTVVYGANPGSCSYHGQTFSGSHSVEIVSASQGNLVVHHVWDELANQRLSVSGTADVTWSSAEASRRVVHELEWTELATGGRVTGSGDRTMTALAGGIAEGIQVEGARQWTSARGGWDLDIDGVEMRWIDPVPQAGSYALATPFGEKTLGMTFQRVDEDTIRVEITNGVRGFTFLVNRAGNVTQG